VATWKPAGQVTVGFSWSTMVTLKWQVALLPAKSTASQATRVAPNGNITPEAWLQDTATPSFTSSVAVTEKNPGIAVFPSSAITVTPVVGQLMVGGDVSV
jgi:hypothetical protein